METHIRTTLQKAIPQLFSIYLFGSVAANEETSRSDIDIAFLAEFNTAPSAVERFKLAQELAIHFDRDVDLIDLREASTVFAYEIVAKGDRIFSTGDDEIDTYENYVFSRYFRFADTRARIVDQIKADGSVL